MSLVTVVVPTYNRAKVLGRAIQSVLAQTHREFELLVVDDGSVDGTKQVVQQVSDPRIIYIKHEKNLGKITAVNLGIRVARGEYISFLDSDDEWLPVMLEKQLAVFQQNDDSLGLVYALTGSRRADGSIGLGFDSQLRGNVYNEVLKQGYLAPMITLMVRRDCFQKIGLFDTRLVVCEDDDICFRLAKEYRVDLVPEVLAIIHQDADSRLTSDLCSYAQGWWNLFTKHESEIRRECGDRVLAAHFLKSGKLFLDAHQPKLARRAFAQARSIAPLRMVVMYDAIARWIPFAWPLLRKLKSSLGRVRRFLSRVAE